MATSRDDFVIAVRSAFLKKKDKQKFSLLTLLFLSIFVIILSNYNFKVIKFIKIGINEITYRASFLISTPENKIENLNSQIKDHLEIYYNYKNLESELETLKQKELTNNFLEMENEKLRELINESINSNGILAKVLIDKESPFLKSIILNKGSKDNLKIGMAVADEVYLVGKIQYTKEEYGAQIKNKKIIAYTSGQGGLFKPGLPVGKISKDNINEINFFSDFKQLEYVKIISHSIEEKN